MRPLDLTPFGAELAIKWDDGTESFAQLETLRRFCPCAACMGEQDIFGQTYKAPERPYGPSAFQLADLIQVGSYGVRPVWGDGHNAGIFTWAYLKQVAGAEATGVKPV